MRRLKNTSKATRIKAARNTMAARVADKKLGQFQQAKKSSPIVRRRTQHFQKGGHRTLDKFGKFAKVLQRRKFGGKSNAAVLDYAKKRIVNNRKHSMTNKGILNLGKHTHFRRRG